MHSLLAWSTFWNRKCARLWLLLTLWDTRCAQVLVLLAGSPLEGTLPLVQQQQPQSTPWTPGFCLSWLSTKRTCESFLSVWVCPWLSLLPITIHPQVSCWQGFIISSLTWLPFHKLDQWPSSYLLAPLERNAHHCHSIFMGTQGGVGSRRLGRYFCTAFSVLLFLNLLTTLWALSFVFQRWRRWGCAPHSLSDRTRLQTKVQPQSAQWIDFQMPLFAWISSLQLDSKSFN